jgi:hypothetical protein
MIATGIKLNIDFSKQSSSFHTEKGTDMAVETIANIYRGTLAKMGAIDMKLVPATHSIVSGLSSMNQPTKAVHRRGRSRGYRQRKKRNQKLAKPAGWREDRRNKTTEIIPIIEA